MKSAFELFEELNAQDESTEVEAKGAGPINRSVMESVCAFANEPDLGGGYILIGANKDDSDLFPYYAAEDIGDPDKLQSDLATQCNIMFNLPVRPRMVVERVNNSNVLVVHVDELPTGQKPLHFKKDGLPQGAYRRVGPTDHRCTEDDMALFYTDRDTYDRIVLKRTSIKDIDLNALDTYRKLRERINSAAEELTFDDSDLLLALGCLDPDTRIHLTVAGLLLFGSSAALRREMPMVRADYIRVPGTEWVADPDNRFRTVDMRGPLISLVYRLVEAVHADLPKGFMLEEGELQAGSSGLPVKALREAIVNALMHRSYRVNSPIQVIRYDNRIEIRNPGYSLKSQENLGKPGSETRNPIIATVFHETNLAETKGSGIGAMRKLLEKAHLAPPTFESDRQQNLFTARLLLHHFLNEPDLEWLATYDPFGLNDNQKRGLIMVRELGAIDNLSYRQQSGTDTLTASQELRSMRDLELLHMMGKGSATYYIPGNRFVAGSSGHDDLSDTDTAPHLRVVKTTAKVVNTQPLGTNTQGQGENTQGQATNTQGQGINTQALSRDPVDPRVILLRDLPEELCLHINTLGKRISDPSRVQSVILALCSIRPYSKEELATLLNKREDYIRTKFIKPMIQSGKLKYRYPDMVSHPDQAYLASK